MIYFNAPSVTGEELKHLTQLCQAGLFTSDGSFTRENTRLIMEYTKSPFVLFTPSCTHSLEMAALLLNICPGDEVILPSFTFTSTANAFLIRGAQLVFVDIRPDTLNIDENLIEQAITSKTKAIIAVHYAGHACEMNRIMQIARKHKLYVVEDAAQAILNHYEGRALGSIGDVGTFSFHETKNIQCGEGGATLINNPDLIERAEILREKGTNRKKFYRGQVDKYTWVDIGSSYLMSEIVSAFLHSQLVEAEHIINKRKNIWRHYFNQLLPLAKKGLLTLPLESAIANGHIFHIRVKQELRDPLLAYLKENNIFATFHYIPLHSAEMGQKVGRFVGEDRYTTVESQKLIRLPMHNKLTDENIATVVTHIAQFLDR